MPTGSALRLRRRGPQATRPDAHLGARITVLPPQQRPHYPPQERAAILALAARTGWNNSKTADTFLLTAATIANWMRVVDVKGPDALVKPRKPINRFPAFVTAVVQQLSGLAPRIGKRQLAAIVARAGIAISASTVGRMRKRAPVKARTRQGRARGEGKTPASPLAH